MFRLSSTLILISSVLIFGLLTTSQMGASGEVSPGIMGAGYVLLVLATLFVISSVIFLVFSLKRKRIIKLKRNIYIAWLVSILFAMLFGWSGDVFQWPARYPFLSLLLKNSFWYGTIISLILFGGLIIGNIEDKFSA